AGNVLFFFLQAEDGIRAFHVTGVQTCALPISSRLGLRAEIVPGDWRRGADPERLAEILAADPGHEIKAVCAVHNETSTGAVSRIAELRAALDAAGHPALLLVDTISSLGSIDYRHDEWGDRKSVAEGKR